MLENSIDGKRKENLTERGDSGEMMSMTGQVEQRRSVRGRRETDNNAEVWGMK